MIKPLDTATAYEELVSAIVKVVPEINEPVEIKEAYFAENPKNDRPAVYEDCYRDITLEDVLRAYQRKPSYGAASLHRAMLAGKVRDNDYLKILSRWHLGKPLSEQSDETKLFLHTLLHA